MSQSSFIAAALLGGFVLFLAATGRLPIYAAVLWGDTSKPVSGSSGSSSKSKQNISNDVNTAVDIAKLFAV